MRLSGVAQHALMRMSDKHTESLPLMDAEDVVMRELFVAALDIHAAKRRYSVETLMKVWTDEIEVPDLDQTLSFVGIASSGTPPTVALFRWAQAMGFTDCRHDPVTGERKKHASGRGVDGCHLDLSKFDEEPIVDGIIFVPDTIIATGGTGKQLIADLQERELVRGSTKFVFLAPIATQQGMSAIQGEHDHVFFVVGRIDPTVTEDGYVEPGGGDFGKRKKRSRRIS